MLNNDFFFILNREAAEAGKLSGGKFIYSIRLAGEHPVYGGHFPGNPVVPGACQVGMIKELVAAAMAQELVLDSADNIKFLSMIQPGVNPDLRVEIDISRKETDHIDVSATITAPGKIFMKFRGKFRTVRKA